MLLPEGDILPNISLQPWFSNQSCRFVLCWSSLMPMVLCFTFSLVIQMKLTYHPTLELAPNATCLRKSWMRAWIEITFSLTSWPTCTVSDSSFGRLLGDVYQEVSNSDPVRATTNPFIHIRSQLYCPQRSDFSFFFYLFLLMHSQSSQEMIFHILGWFLTTSFPPPTTEKSLLDTLWTSFVLSKITSFCYTRCLISLSISFSSCCLKSDPFSTLPSFVLPTF